MIKENEFLKNLKVSKDRPAVDNIKRNDAAVFKLDKNESPAQPPRAVIESIKDFLNNKNSVNWYGESSAGELRKEIAKYCGVKSGQIIVTNGSDQAAELVSNTFLREKGEAVIPVPTFDTFRIWPAMRGSRIIEVPYGLDSGPNADKIIQAISKRTKLIYLVNPYIFTLEKNDIKKIAKAAPNAAIFVDEAYFEFYGRSSVGLIKNYRNIIVTRTFSKGFMLAGLRIGYIVADKKIAASIEKVRARYSANAIGQAAAIAALKRRKYAADYAAAIRKSREYVKKRLEKIGFRVFTTDTCFVLIKHNRVSQKKVVELLEKRKVFVRALDNPAGYIRMNLGYSNLMKKVAAIFEELFI
ncbi:MAG: histidinol-phosphate aminotransferase family protein [Candidatus Liptonbacteria bacterium]|nr:histidinol-phosphate aminotransferase family protein [Candidatus Liptonbacteria bacterium]